MGNFIPKPWTGIHSRFGKVGFQALLPIVIHSRCYAPHVDIRSHWGNRRIGRIIPILANTAVFAVLEVKGMRDESLP